jgi:diguanylate cyclase (GGDEF)-like protein
MKMRVEGTFLTGRIARRVFALFCLAALLPVGVLWLFTERAIDTGVAAADAEARLALAKGYALNVFERLDTADGLLQRVPIEPGDDPAVAEALAPIFSRMWRLDASTRAADPRAEALARAAERQPEATLLTLPADGGGGPAQLALLRRPLAADRALAPLVAVFDPVYVWGRSDELPADIAVCVRDADGRPLHCPTAPRGAGAQRWPLFLKAAFGVESWMFEVDATPRTTAGRGSGLLAVFGLVASGTLLLALLLSLVQIRRILVPLERLVAQTRQVARGRYAPLAMEAEGEFRELAEAFDDMGRRVERQFDMLRALSDVDRRMLTQLDLDAIIERVLTLAGAVAPAARLAVVNLRSDEGGVADVHVLGADSVQRHRHVIDASLARRLARPGGGPWCEAASPVTEAWRPLLGDLESAVERLLPLAARGRVVGCLALAGEAPEAAALEDLRELAERIAVAIAAREREDLLVFQARHDALTGLPNRLDALEAVSGALARAAHDHRALALLFIDLDGFKAINDGMGHAVGDAVLGEVARVVARSLPPGTYLARLGGDEFIALLSENTDAAAIARVAGAVCAAVATPFKVGAIELSLTCSIGVAAAPGDGRTAEALIRNADIAMYRAKRGGRARFVFFEERMNAEAEQAVRLQADLRTALREGGLRVEYQPRVDARNGRIVAVEALVRWPHEQLGLVPPSVFVPLAEDCGLIEDLGEWVLAQACREFAAWRAAGHAIRSVAVNVSGRQLRSPRLVAAVRSAIARHQLRHGELEIEITETVLVDDVDGVLRQLDALRELGAAIAVDDFGTGYSSLAYLRRLPVDTIKIDRTFIVDMVGSHQALALVRAIIAMCEALGKQIVAEGVENDEQVAILRSWGCHLVQGYVMHPPMSARRIHEELASS